MMVGQNQPMLRPTNTHQRPAQKRRRAKIKPRPAILRQNVRKPRRPRRRIQPGQINQPPRHSHRRHDHLNRTPQTRIGKARPQARMPPHQRLRRRLQTANV
jgi:hypothetical protein